MVSGIRNVSIDVINEYTTIARNNAARTIETMKEKYASLHSPAYTQEEIEQLEELTKREATIEGVLPPIEFKELLETADKYFLIRDDTDLHIAYDIPLVHNEFYQIYSVASTPDITLRTKLDVPAGDVAYNERKQTFFRVDSSSNLMVKIKGVSIYKINQVHNEEAARKDCIAHVLVKATGPPDCPFTRTPEGEESFKAISKHMYVYHLAEDNQAHILCDQQRQLISPRVGLIILPPGCVIESKYSEITNGVDKQIEYQAPDLYVAPSPEWKPDLSFNLTTEPSPDTNATKIEVPPPVEFKEQAIFLRPHDNSWHWGTMIGGGVFLAIIFLIGIVVIIIKLKRVANDPIVSNSMSRTYLSFDPVRRQLNNMGERVSTMTRSIRRRRRQVPSAIELLEANREHHNFLDQPSTSRASVELSTFKQPQLRHEVEGEDDREIDLANFRRSLFEAKQNLNSPHEVPKAIRPTDLPLPPRAWRLSESPMAPPPSLEKF